MSDVSGNDIFEDLSGENESVQSETIVSDTIDYTSYFENMQSIGYIIITVIISIGIILAFISGFNKNG